MEKKEKTGHDNSSFVGEIALSDLSQTEDSKNMKVADIADSKTSTNWFDLYILIILNEVRVTKEAFPNKRETKSQSLFVFHRMSINICGTTSQT
ncbi:UNVERIFIED_CONTAM: hypothetical protein NCL1_38084 [Trichonephila clavipes]